MNNNLDKINEHERNNINEEINEKKDVSLLILS